jgi:hypothetical protein
MGKSVFSRLAQALDQFKRHIGGSLQNVLSAEVVSVYRKLNLVTACESWFEFKSYYRNPMGFGNNFLA